MTPPCQGCLLDHLCTLAVPSTCLVARQHRLGRGDYLFHMHDAPRDTVYLLRSGHVKLTHVSCDGVRRIVDFRGPGDWLGAGALGQCAHDVDARALDDCLVDAIAWQPLAARLAQRPADAAAFSQALGHDIARQQQAATLLRIPAANKRVARFLCQLAAAMPPTSMPMPMPALLPLLPVPPIPMPQTVPRPIPLPMTRQDIGDYLGLTAAAVSRAINTLRRDGVVRFEHRAFVLDAPAALAIAAGL